MSRISKNVPGDLNYSPSLSLSLSIGSLSFIKYHMILFFSLSALFLSTAGFNLLKNWFCFCFLFFFSWSFLRLGRMDFINKWWICVYLCVYLYTSMDIWFLWHCFYSDWHKRFRNSCFSDYSNAKIIQYRYSFISCSGELSGKYLNLYLPLCIIFLLLKFWK